MSVSNKFPIEENILIPLHAFPSVIVIPFDIRTHIINCIADAIADISDY